jgi:hypothetical protein
MDENERAASIIGERFLGSAHISKVCAEAIGFDPREAIKRLSAVKPRLILPVNIPWQA